MEKAARDIWPILGALYIDGKTNFLMGCFLTKSDPITTKLFSTLIILTSERIPPKEE